MEERKKTKKVTYALGTFVFVVFVLLYAIVFYLDTHANSYANSGLNLGEIAGLVILQIFYPLVVGVFVLMIPIALWTRYREFFPSKETKKLREEHERKMRDDPEYHKRMLELVHEEERKQEDEARKRFEEASEKARASSEQLRMLLTLGGSLLALVVLAAVVKWAFNYLF